MAEDQSTNFWSKLAAITAFLTAVGGLATILVQCTTEKSAPSAQQKPVGGGGPMAVAGPQSPATANIAGRWRDNLGVVYEIDQQGNRFTYTAHGVSCMGRTFRSQGQGTVTGNDVASVYESNISSRGTCRAAISNSGMTADCTDTVCGALSVSVVRY